MYRTEKYGARESGMATQLSGQAFVNKLSADTLRDVESAYASNNNTFKKMLSNLAVVEETTANEYRGRYIFELLQNANDAIQDARETQAETGGKPYRVRIELTNNALIVANDGTPFQEKDVDSIHQWGKSSKDPNKSIGYKGIGFKSVLEITESPQIFSRVVQFHFNKQLCFQRVKEIVGDGSALKLPFTYFVFPFSIEEVSPSNQKIIDELLNGAGYATVVRLPLLENVDHSDVIKQIKKDVDPALLLFLGGIDEIDIWIHGKRFERLHRKLNTDSDSGACKQVTLYRNRRITSRWLIFEAPKILVENRELIDNLRQDAWKRVKEVGFTVAYPINSKFKLERSDQPEALFVYFPTEVPSALGFRIHADFFVDANRKTIESLPYNDWLATHIADYFAETILPVLIQKFPDDPSVIKSLIPVSEPQGFADDLLSTLYDRLKTCQFIPTQSGNYAQPNEIMFIPPGVDQELDLFHRYFPPDQLLKFYKGFSFSADALYEDESIVDFVLELDARELSFDDVFRTLDGRNPIPDGGSYAEFYGFLWQWRERLDYGEDRMFSSTLEQSHCIVNRQRKWIKPHEQLFHAKLRQDTPDIPDFLHVDVVHPEVYDDDGRAGAAYQLFGTFSTRVREYDAPAIIRNSIMPLFEGSRFEKMQVARRIAIYKYLFDYWKTRRGGDPDVNQMVIEVKVNAKWISNRRKWVWKKISEVYLSSFWMNDDRLENLYSGMENIAFLYEVRGLDLESYEREEWGRFWQWMGAASIPRCIEENLSREDTKYLTWNQYRHGHAHSNTPLWNPYLGHLRAHSNCTYHGLGYLRLRQSITIEHLESVIESRDVNRLRILFEFLGDNWKYYKSKSTVILKCYRAGCYEESQPLLAHWLYLLRNSEWIPAHSGLQFGAGLALLQPNQCWFVPPTEDAVARSMLPAPLVDTHLRRSDHRQYYRDLGMRFLEEADMDDLVDILKGLPDRYPDPNISVSTGRRPIPKAVGTLTRWVFGRVFNLLSQADAKVAPLAERIPIVASEANQLRYIYPPESVFFADDRYHSPWWKAHLPFAPLDDNWRDVAVYFGIHMLSDHVRESVDPGDLCKSETETLIRSFKRARPYMLAVLNDQRTSAIEESVRYLSNLDIRVVSTLVVNRELISDESMIIPDAKARLYLEETTLQREGSAGRAQRAGVLYVRKGYERNYDLMGAPIAEYIRIPGLSDAFVILLDRGDRLGKMRYLDTRKITEADVSSMRSLLGLSGILDAEEDDANEMDDNGINEHLLRELEKDLDADSLDLSDDDTEAIRIGSGEHEGDRFDPNGREKENPDEQRPSDSSEIEFPPFELDEVISFMVNQPQPVKQTKEGNSQTPSGRGGWHSPNWERDHRLKEAYGFRGEQLVYELELRRLRDLGVNDPEREIRWLRKEGRKTADHDIESFDIIDDKLEPIIIEVKSTPSNDFRVYMSKEELSCARKNGHNYRLHRIIEVASSSPKEFIFENPYELWQQGLALIEPRDTYVILPDPTVTPVEEE
jgi:hypothetical protein